MRFFWTASPKFWSYLLAHIFPCTKICEPIELFLTKSFIFSRFSLMHVFLIWNRYTAILWNDAPLWASRLLVLMYCSSRVAVLTSKWFFVWRGHRSFLWGLGCLLFSWFLRSSLAKIVPLDPSYCYNLNQGVWFCRSVGQDGRFLAFVILIPGG